MLSLQFRDVHREGFFCTMTTPEDDLVLPRKDFLLALICHNRKIRSLLAD